jgi:hypothetical protein
MTRVADRGASALDGPVAPSLSCPDMAEETYDAERERRLERMLRMLADRIRELDGQGRLLDGASELLRLIGDVRSEIFHYEVRATYDTPEIAEHRRMVSEAQRSESEPWRKTEWNPDEDADPSR